MLEERRGISLYSRVVPTQKGRAVRSRGEPILLSDPARRLAMERAPIGRDVLLALLVFTGSAAIFSINLDRLPFPDELYHILAAKGLVETGEPRIAEGLYWRGYLQTWLTAWSFRLFGESLATARIPSVLFAAGLVTASFWWLRARVGTSIALLGAVFYALSPFAITIAQFCRFYALQTLSFFLAAVAIAEAANADRSPKGRFTFLALGLLALGLAIHLQPVSTIGGLGIALYLGGAVLLPKLIDPTLPWVKRFGPALVVSSVLVFGLAASAASGLLDELWSRFRQAETFNAHLADQFWYYHAWYQLFFPTLWPATGLLALAAFARWPRPAALALSVFTTAFLLSSLAAPKSLRYIAYAHPFLIILWTLGLAAVWANLRETLSALVTSLAARFELPTTTGRGLARFLVGGAIAFLVLANPAWLRSVTLLADVPVPPERPPVDWPAAKPVLAPYLASGRFVVTSEELGTLYFLGRFDLTLNASRYDEIVRGTGPTIVRDPRTGRGVGRDLAATRLVLACRAPGVFISLEQFWNDAPQIVAPTVKTFLLAHARPLELPAGSRLVAFVWDERSGEAAECAELEPIAVRHDR